MFKFLKSYWPFFKNTQIKTGRYKNIFSRIYNAARSSRLTTGWGQSTTSADSEISISLTNLRNRSRALIRDSGYAKRAKEIIVNNVIGTGIGLQARVMNNQDNLKENVNDEIESLWEEWSEPDNCHTGGSLCFADMERLLLSETVEAGEIFVRKHYKSFGKLGIPYTLEIIESERIPHGIQPMSLNGDRIIRLGVEIDLFYKPQAYWINRLHPGELNLITGEIDQVERIPSDQVAHLRLIDRWPQTRGVPWFHSVMRKINDLDGYTEAEIIAARGAACYMASLETQGGESAYPEKQEDGSRQISLEPGTVPELGPGEKLNFNNPNRPNSQADPFIRSLLREISAGIGTSYESLSRDYSQSNYSSSRLALLDDRDVWRMLQWWYIRSFRYQTHKEWLQMAILSGKLKSIDMEEYANNPRKFESAYFKARGWNWVDPEKEVAAYKDAVRCGFITVSDVIAQTGNGRDLEDVINERRRELDLMHDKELVFDTDTLFEQNTSAPNSNSGNGDQQYKALKLIRERT